MLIVCMRDRTVLRLEVDGSLVAQADLFWVNPIHIELPSSEMVPPPVTNLFLG
jgi:hypothetical protein